MGLFNNLISELGFKEQTSANHNDNFEIGIMEIVLVEAKQVCSVRKERDVLNQTTNNKLFEILLQQVQIPNVFHNLRVTNLLCIILLHPINKMKS